MTVCKRCGDTHSVAFADHYGQEVTRMCTTPCACECHERRTIAVNADGSIAGHVEPDGRFMPALTDRERACLRGEHEPLTAEDANGVFPRTFVGRLVALVCRHCRCLYAARAA